MTCTCTKDRDCPEAMLLLDAAMKILLKPGYWSAHQKLMLAYRDHKLKAMEEKP